MFDNYLFLNRLLLTLLKTILTVGQVVKLTCCYIYCKDTKLYLERKIRQRQHNILINPLVPQKRSGSLRPCYLRPLLSLFLRLTVLYSTRNKFYSNYISHSVLNKL